MRTIAPPLQQRLIYRAFDGLPVGGTLELLGDRDLLPLLVEVRARCAGAFEMHAAEAGPRVWRLRLRKLGRCVISEGQQP